MPATLERFYPGVAGSSEVDEAQERVPWEKSKERLMCLCKPQATSDALLASTRLTTKLPRDSELDLIKCINGYRLEGAPISAVMLTRKSLQIASEFGVSATAFVASWTWRQAFLRRHKLDFREVAFSSELQKRMGELGLDVMYNADQKTVFFEHIPTRTIAAKGTQTVWARSGGRTKDRVTCMLLDDSFGNKYETFLIFKTTTPMKKVTPAENNAKRHGFGKRLWIKMRDLQSTLGLQICDNATAC
uniref:Uncharacterized protein AlNc14C710G12425 n=1 Tax=Albugo laibachii Nc14 TaxID=890382 RepID=F0X1W1_9STRA|nr:conserved hypothetical protein [Albugo laibachii Nc14]|eukprot:CCA27818.1 conserved hypothetical protein [Albugo laibachii Nc14]